MNRLLINSAGMSIKRSDGKSIFDTDDKLFHPITTISGTIAMQPIAGGGDVFVHRTTAFNLGAVNAGCTQVIGAMRFTLNNYAAGAAFDRWTMVMGGSIVWVIDGETGSQSHPGANTDVMQMVTYHFDISAGQCRLVQHVALDRLFPSTFYTVRAHSIEYRLRCGVWV